MTVWEQLVYLLRGLPDWIAWRLEAFVVKANDRQISWPVRDALTIMFREELHRG